MGTLTERVAVVTGGGRGLGRGIALALAEFGADVAVIARSTDEITQVAAEIRETVGVRAVAVTCDVADWDAVQRAVDEIEAELGYVNLLVNNAGILGPIDITTRTDPAQWALTQQINVNGAYFMLRAVLPGMLKRKWGRIINISSGAARNTGMSHLSAYSVSKAALNMLTLAVGAEIAETDANVRVNSVAPGVIDTAMQTTIRKTPVEKAGEKTATRFRGLHADGKLRDAQSAGREVAAIALGEWRGDILDIRDEDTKAKIAALLDGLD